MKEKILIAWVFLVALLWLLSKIEYRFYGGALTWKYYRQEHSWFWAAYIFLLVIGNILGTLYLLIKLAQWWFHF